MNDVLRRYYRQIDWSKVEAQPYRLIVDGLGVEELIYCVENYKKRDWVIKHSPLCWGEIRGQFLLLAEINRYMSYHKFRQLFPTSEHYRTRRFYNQMKAELEKYKRDKTLWNSSLRIRYYDFSTEAWNILEQVDFNRHPDDFERGFYRKFGLEKYLTLYIIFGGRGSFYFNDELHKIPEVREQLIKIMKEEGILKAKNIADILEIQRIYAYKVYKKLVK